MLRGAHNWEAMAAPRARALAPRVREWACQLAEDGELPLEEARLVRAVGLPAAGRALLRGEGRLCVQRWTPCNC